MKCTIMPFKCLLAIFLLLGSGCSSISEMDLFTEDRALNNLIIFSDEKMNDGRPLSVDMVWIKDKSTQSVFSKIDSNEWFSKRNDLMKIFNGKISGIAWEIVPGQVIQEASINQTMPKNSYSILVFANYNTENKNAYELPNYKNIQLKLEKNSFQISRF